MEKDCDTCFFFNRKRDVCTVPQEPLLDDNGKCKWWQMEYNGIRTIEVLVSRMKLVVIPGFGATPDSIDTALAFTGLDEITLRNTDYDYIRKYSKTGKYEGAKRDELEKHLHNLGWRQWKQDKNIWLKPGHRSFGR